MIIYQVRGRQICRNLVDQLENLEEEVDAGVGAAVTVGSECV